MAATVTLTADKTTVRSGDVVVFTATYSGLDPGVPATTQSGPGHIRATLSPSGVVVEGDSPNLTFTDPGRPAETVGPEAVTYRGATAVKRPDGKFVLTVP